MIIILNGDPHEVPRPLTVSELLAGLEIDARRVAVEHNLVVLKRATFDNVVLREGDQVEIVNFVGGGARRVHTWIPSQSPARPSHRASSSAPASTRHPRSW